MYKGKNPTAIQSQKWFKQSLLKLCTAKPYKNISVKELCAKADLSRQTFYMLFKSKEEIIELFIDDLFEDVISKIDFDNMNIHTLMDFCFGLYKKDMPGLKILIKNNLVWILRKKLREQIYSITSQIRKSEMSDDMLNYAAAFISGAIIDVIVYLYSNNIHKTSEELSELVYYLLKGDYLKEFEGTDSELR